MDPITLALLALGGAALLGGRRKGRAGAPSGPALTDEERMAMRAYIRDTANFISNKYGAFPGLANYLDAVAFWESRYKPHSIAGSSKNSARGLFQMRPKTAFSPSTGLQQFTSQPDILFDPTWAIIMATEGVSRAALKVERSGFQANWLAIRRWWRLPRLATDFNETDPQSRSVRRKFETALDAVGLPHDFMFESVQRGGWPGAIPVLNDFGLL